MYNRYVNDTQWRIVIGGGILAAALIIIGLAWVFNYRYITKGTIVATNWELHIDRLQYQTIKDSDWNPPNDARIYDRRRERYSTEHYFCGYESNGDDKYCDRPVYKTKYYYEVDRWVNIAPLVTQGNTAEDIHWPDITDATYNDTEVLGNVKLGTYHSYLQVLVNAEGKVYSAPMTQDLWNTYHSGDVCKITLGYFNNVLDIQKGNI